MTNTTTISSETMDLSEMFPVEPENKDTTLFDKKNETVNIDDDKVDEDDEPKKPVVVDEPKVAVKEFPLAASSEPVDLEDLETKEFEEAKAGKKADLVEFFKTKIEAGDLVPFSDFDDTKQTIDEYLATFKTKDFDQLWKDNLDNKEQEFANKLPQEFFEALPEELQYAAKYVQDGGTDMKSLFKVLAQVQEVKELDPEKDARRLAEQYLIAKKFGTDEDIKEQLDEWDDLGVMDKKSAKFKPELDKMQTEILQAKLDAQANIKVRQQEQYDFYHDNVVEAIRTEDLGGIKLDKKTQSALYTGLTQHDHKDSRGKTSTEFEYLLDQIMWVKPDYQKLAKIHWLLRDEAGFEKALATRAINSNVEETVRTLKTEQMKKKASTPDAAAPKRTLPPRPGGMFSR